MLHYKTRGNSEGPWLVMLHGLFGAAENLGGIARLLEEDFHLLMIDARNHGRSPHMQGLSYPAMADDTLEVMEHLSVEKAHIFGHSMGGKTAMQVALQAASKIEKLLVGDIAPVRYDRHHQGILKGMQAVAAAAPDGRKGAEEILGEYVEESDVLSFLLTNWRRLDGGAWGWRLGLEHIINDYDDIIQAPSGKPFEGPVLFLRGANSNYIKPEHRADTGKLFPAAEVRNFEGCGHWLHAEKPDMVARTMIRFLER